MRNFHIRKTIIKEFKLKKYYAFLYLLIALFFGSCYGIEEFNPGTAYFTTENNTLVLYYSGEYNKNDVVFELHSLNPITDERKSSSILSVDKLDSKLVIKYEDDIPAGFTAMIYVFIYGKFEKAITVQDIKK